jgi:hypothetical protein
VAPLRIQHPVPDFAAWKDAVDRDPVQRERSGVRRYRPLRPADDPPDVLVDLEVDLEVDRLAEAQAMQAALRALWGHVDGTVLTNPQVRIVEAVESKEY